MQINGILWFEKLILGLKYYLCVNAVYLREFKTPTGIKKEHLSIPNAVQQFCEYFDLRL